MWGVIRRACRTPLCAWLLNGLTRYELWPDTKQDKTAAGKKGAKASRKAPPPKPDQAELLSGLSTPIARTLTLKEVTALEGFGAFSNVVRRWPRSHRATTEC